jgi:hypothetical protein
LRATGAEIPARVRLLDLEVVKGAPGAVFKLRFESDGDAELNRTLPLEAEGATWGIVDRRGRRLKCPAAAKVEIQGSAHAILRYEAEDGLAHFLGLYGARALKAFANPAGSGVRARSPR